VTFWLVYKCVFTEKRQTISVTNLMNLWGAIYASITLYIPLIVWYLHESLGYWNFEVLSPSVNVCGILDDDERAR